MEKSETAFCISCGKEIQVDTEYCPECGSSQNPEDLNETESPESTEHSGFTSWAIGFKPGSTGRNVIVAIAYFFFASIGIPLLIYAYLVEYPEKQKYLAWGGGILFILVALGAFGQASARGIIAGSLSLAIGLLFLPPVREKLGVNPPGVDTANSSRRNVLVGIGYGFGGMIAVGAALPKTESEGTNAEPDNGGNDPSGEDPSTPTPEQEEYPNAWYYHEDTGILLEDTPEAESDSIDSLYIRGDATNESDNDYDYVQIEFDVLDSSGTKIADALDNTSGLSAGQSWRYEAVAVSAEDVDSYELADITAY